MSDPKKCPGCGAVLLYGRPPCLKCRRAAGDFPTEVSTVAAEAMDLIARRDRAGQQKYGVSMDRQDLTIPDWLRHSIEEHADALQYELRALRDLERVLATAYEHGYRRGVAGAPPESAEVASWLLGRPNPPGTVARSRVPTLRLNLHGLRMSRATEEMPSTTEFVPAEDFDRLAADHEQLMKDLGELYGLMTPPPTDMGDGYWCHQIPENSFVRLQKISDRFRKIIFRGGAAPAPAAASGSESITPGYADDGKYERHTVARPVSPAQYSSLAELVRDFMMLADAYCVTPEQLGRHVRSRLAIMIELLRAGASDQGNDAGKLRGDMLEAAAFWAEDGREARSEGDRPKSELCDLAAKQLTDFARRLESPTEIGAAVVP